ncbi:hypothetical protein [uncultured Duncaniella sp.]|uniref:hypothetical protein n=1 Tax=uncultured Duncaniella sp. TaxID=2768039 RepID=UPI002634E9C7|nr:hypothetical protein [uncultured Duncaniella sp.]
MAFSFGVFIWHFHPAYALQRVPTITYPVGRDGVEVGLSITIPDGNRKAAQQRCDISIPDGNRKAAQPRCDITMPDGNR